MSVRYCACGRPMRGLWTACHRCRPRDRSERSRPPHCGRHCERLVAAMLVDPERQARVAAHAERVQAELQRQGLLPATPAAP